MGLNDIVVYVDGAEAAKARVDFAVALAKAHGAHLIGVAFAPTTLLPLYGADVGFADMTEVLDSVKAQGAKALDAFKTRAGAEEVSHETRLMQGMSEEFPHDFAYAARHADLAILGQPRDGDPLIGQYALVERCLFASGRPVFVVPAAPKKLTPDGVVVVAWDGSAEAARAINDALAFLKPASRVVLLVGIPADQDEENAPQTGDMIAHLKRHGVVAEAADGYRVLYALAEFDAAFTNAVILVADRRNGEALGAEDGPLRIVVPWEKRQARWARQLIALRVGRAP